jgi:hypothetical protein
MIAALLGDKLKRYSLCKPHCTSQSSRYHFIFERSLVEIVAQRLASLRFFVVCLSPFRQMTGQYLNIFYCSLFAAHSMTKPKN